MIAFLVLSQFLETTCYICAFPVPNSGGSFRFWCILPAVNASSWTCIFRLYVI